MKKRMISLLLTLAMVLSLMPTMALSALAARRESDAVATLAPAESEELPSTRHTGPEQVEEDAGQGGIDEDVLARLRAGQLTAAEVEALIAQGLTVADLMDPYAVSLMGLVDSGQTMEDSINTFSFLINIPRQTPVTYSNFAALKAKYPDVSDWSGPVTGPQATVEADGSLKYIRRNYPILGDVAEIVNGERVLVDYEVTRLSYHDTTVYRIGYVEITTADAGTHKHLYASSEIDTGSTSHFVLPADAQITVEYSPVEYHVTYEVYVDGVSSATHELEGGGTYYPPVNVRDIYGLHAIYGNTRPKTTTNQHVSPTITIPEGYYGRVYIGEFNRASRFPVKLEDQTAYLADGTIYDTAANAYEKFPLVGAQAATATYGRYALGVEPVYAARAAEGNNPNELVIDATRGPAYFSLNGTYLSGVVGSANDDLLVRVVLEKRAPESYTFSDAEWLKTYTGGIVQTDKIHTGAPSVTMNDEAVDKNEDGTYTVHADGFTWSFTTQAVDGRGICELRTLSVNGKPVGLPFVVNPSGTATETDTVEDFDLGFAKVTVTVTAYGDDESYGVKAGQREYEVTFTNVTRDIVITTSALALENSEELVISTLDGVVLQLWGSVGESVTANNGGWCDVEQGRILRIDTSDTSAGLHFNWGMYAAIDNLPGDLVGIYNARFKPAEGYTWGAVGAAGSVRFLNETFHEASVQVTEEKAEDGWYYAKLSNPGVGSDTTASYLAIQAQLQKYQLNYMDGITEGTALQKDVSGLPETVKGMPDFSQWNGRNGDKESGVPGDDSIPAARDNNSGQHYDMINHEAIVVDANVPTDASESDRPAVFHFWVLTNADGKPIDQYGNEITDYATRDESGKITKIDVSKLKTYKGDYTADLRNYKNDEGYVGYSFPQGNSNLYDIYLTAYWVEAAHPFVYYITMNKIDAEGQRKTNISQPKHLRDGVEADPDGEYGEDDYVYTYPMVQADGETPIEGDEVLRGAFVDRRAYAKVDKTTVIVDIESGLARNFLKGEDDSGDSNLWYKFDEFGKYTQAKTYQTEEGAKHGHIYVVENYDEVDVWLYYTLGSLTVKHEAAGASDEDAFTYEITFTLPADDASTEGNENAFFDEGMIAAFEKAGLSNLEGSQGIYNGTFTLKGAKDSITFPDLPAGTTYVVEQKETADGYVQTGMAEDTAVARTKDGVPAPDKIQTGAGTDKKDQALTINALYDNTLTVTNSAVTVGLTTGTATYTGKDQTVAITAAVKVTMGEDTIDSENYTVTITGGTGTDAGILTNGKPVNAGNYTVTIKGTHNGKPFTAITTFKVEKADPAAEMFTVTPESAEYTAVAQAVEVTLEEPYTNEDGQITWKYYQGETVVSEPIIPGDYTVKVTVTEGKNLKGTTAELEVGTFTIEKADLVNATVRLDPTGAQYEQGTVKKPTVTLMMFPYTEAGSEETKYRVTLTEKKEGMEKGDYTVKYGPTSDGNSDYIQVGTYTITMTAETDSYFKGTTSRPFTISSKSINDEANARAESVTYDGKPWWERAENGADRMAQVVKVTKKTAPDEELTYGTDYLVNFRRDEAVGADTYYLTITGAGEYYGTFYDVPFIIKPAPVEAAALTLSRENISYNGTDRTAEIARYVNASLAQEEGYTGDLTADDFNVTVTPKEDINKGTGVINAGTYDVTITGKGNFTGKATTPAVFTIGKADPIKDMFDVSIPANSAYDGKPRAATLNGLKAPYTDNGGNDDAVKYVFKYYKEGEAEGTTEPPFAVGTYTVKLYVDGSGQNLIMTDGIIMREVELGTFSIEVASVNNLSIEFTDIPPEGYIYNGPDFPKMPTVAVKYGDTTLSPDNDYEVEHSNNVNAGNGIVTVKARESGSYRFEDRTVTYPIAKKQMELQWTLDQNLVYDGTAKGVSAGFKSKNVLARDNVTLSLINDKNINADTYYAQVSITDYSGNYLLPQNLVREYTIQRATPAAKMFTVTVPAGADLTYNGSPKGVTVTLNDPYTNPGGAVTVIYTDEAGISSTMAPTAAGTYTVTLTVDDNGRNLKATTTPLKNASWTFTITQTAPTVTAPTANTPAYNGTAQALVTAGSTTGGTLVYGIGSAEVEPTDYSEEIPTATDAGTYYVWYKAEGGENYEDSEAGFVPVTIVPGEPTAEMFTVTAPTTDLTYNGQPKIATVALKDAYTDKGGSHTVEYYKNGVKVEKAEDAGTYTVKVVVDGKGQNLKATEAALDGGWTFTITKAHLGNATITMDPESALFNNSEIKPEITVEMNGKTLVEKTESMTTGDYTVTYGPGRNAGSPKDDDYIRSDTYDIIIKAVDGGNYEGQVTRTFTIADKSLEKATVVVKDATYDGADWQDRMGQVVTVTLEGDGTEDTVLRYGEDYTVAFARQEVVNATLYIINIRGINGYAGVIAKEFNIVPASIAGAEVELGKNNADYNGADHTAEITGQVTASLAEFGPSKAPRPLTAEDFDVSITPDSNANTGTGVINAGTYTVRITGKGNFRGEKAAETFEINKIDPTAAMFDVIIPTGGIYDGNVRAAELRGMVSPFTDNGDHTLKYYMEGETDGTAEPPSAVGSYTVVVAVTNGTNLNDNEVEVGSFEIAPQAVSSLTVTLLLPAGGYTYDGTGKTPEVAVMFGTATLQKGVDYEVAYGENINAGYGTVTVTATGTNYNFDPTTASFPIAKADPAAEMFTVTPPTDLAYNGQPKAATVTLKDTYTDGGAYTLVYYKDGSDTGSTEAPTEGGKYTVKVTVDGAGKNLNATKAPLEDESWVFTIAKAVIDSNARVELNIAGAKYDGKAHKPEVTSVTVNGQALKKDADYEVIYAEDDEYIENGEYIITIRGKGDNYEGETTVTFRISKETMENVTVDVSAAVYDGRSWNRQEQGDSNLWSAEERIARYVTVMNGETGEALAYLTDYTVVFLDPAGSGDQTVTNAGVYPIRIMGQGDYAGWIDEIDGKMLSFQIQRLDLGDPRVTAEVTGIPATISYIGEDWSAWIAAQVRVEATLTPAAGETPDGGSEDVFRFALALGADLELTITRRGSDEVLKSVVDAGEYTVHLKGLGNYTGELIRDFAIEMAALDVVPPMAKDRTYDGTVQALVIAGFAADGTLEYALGNETAATETYSTNIPTAADAGVYYVWYRVVGSENDGEATEDKVTVTIARAAIDSNAQVLLKPEAEVYDGQVHKPGVSVTVNSRKLEEGRDFDVTVEPAEVVNAGSYTVTVTGKGNYKNTLTATFTILPADLSKATVALSPASATHNGKVQKPSVTVTMPDGTKLTENKDFTISWGSGDYTKVGSYTVTLKGTGNYDGTITAGFEIKASGSTGGGGTGGGTGGGGTGGGFGGGGAVGGGTGEAPTPPSISEGNHGKTTVQPGAPKKGDTVTVLPQPKPGYAVGDVVVKDRNGNKLQVTDHGDGSYSFVQPDGSVTIDVDFVCTHSDEYCCVAAFRDASPNNWYHDGIHYCVENGLMTGVGNDLFAPNDPTTRAMIATILWRLEGSPIVANAAGFDDVADGQWYSDAIRWAASSGVVQGVGNGLFRPNGLITREQLMVMLYRYGAYKGYNVSVGNGSDIFFRFDDAADSSDWAVTALQWAVDYSLTTGKGNNTLAPLDTGSRAEVATLFQRFCTEILD